MAVFLPGFRVRLGLAGVAGWAVVVGAFCASQAFQSGSHWPRNQAWRCGRSLGSGGIERRLNRMGSRGPSAQAGKPGRVECPNRVAHRLIVAAQVLGDMGRCVAPSTGQHDLTAAEDKGIARA